ncbi:MAG TPA: glycoside hydrolase family 11 protein [Polyangiaceae bacterium]|nr:glycoside hydrolase family 11 protein [Polyangiaceae bacterium]
MQAGGTTSTSAGGSSSGGATSKGGAAPIGGQGTTGGFGAGAVAGLGSGGSSGMTTGGRAAGGANAGGPANGGRAAGGANSGGSANAGRAAGGANTAGGSGQGASAGSGPSTVDCNATLPSGGTQHSGNSQGGSNNLAWQIWSNQGTGTLTTFSTPAFSAAWNNSGDYLGRLGFEWGNGGKTYDQYGTITAGFTFKKTGSGGGFSYIGIYGWSTNPCIEWYIVDDSFGNMPFTPYNASQKGSTTMIDGENYKFYSNPTNGTGGSRCNASSWTQFWSIRQKARQCGTITISDHFAAWDAAGMKLGTLLEAKLLVETGGGSGSVDFAVADLEKTQ